MDKPKIGSKATIIAIVLLFLIVTPLALSLLLPQHSLAVGAIEFYSVPVNRWGFQSHTGGESVLDPAYHGETMFPKRKIYEFRDIECGAFAVAIRGKQLENNYE
ncbi:MAG: hypothetical protein JWQ02_4178 [Capsulimonas sp.]|jgi:hypothetical protein|nr:hypothetical protein [Capsulimonas sp.]